MQKTISLFLFLSACVTNPNSTDDGSGGGGGGGGGGNSSGDWKPIPLVNDGEVPRAGNDAITGIYFASADKGYVVTRASNKTLTYGGALFKIAGGKASVAYSGVDFTGVVPTPNGVVALASASQLVTGGANDQFAVTQNGDLGGIAEILAFRQTASDTTVVAEKAVYVANGPAGPNATYNTTWAPIGRPGSSNPNSDQCEEGPRRDGNPNSAYIGNGLIAYTSAFQYVPQLCISSDGGNSFIRHTLTVADDDTSQPKGVLFTSAQNGITWSSPLLGKQSGKAFIQRTTDGGKTWNAVSPPAAIATHEVELAGGFFAPDGLHGWIVGTDHTTNTGLGITTADGGATWSMVSGLGTSKLYTGFALDATHVWIGGDDGVLLVNH